MLDAAASRVADDEAHAAIAALGAQLDAATAAQVPDRDLPARDRDLPARDRHLPAAQTAALHEALQQLRNADFALQARRCGRLVLLWRRIVVVALCCCGGVLLWRGADVDSRASQHNFSALRDSLQRAVESSEEGLRELEQHCAHQLQVVIN